jgi:LacI family transcriptional regulator
MVRRVLAALQWYDAQLHAGIASVAREEGWDLLCSVFHQDVEAVPAGWKGDGAVSLISDARLHRRLRRACPQVIELGYWGASTISRVVPDHEAIARLAVSHFRERGFLHFACVHVPGEPMFDLRSQAFCALLFRQGITATPLRWPPLRTGTSWSARLATLGAQLKALPAPLAVFAVQDRVGAEAVLAAIAAGLAVPERLSVLGVDNVELLDETLPVPLSSIDTDPFGIGRQAACLLKLAMDGEKPPLVTRLPPRRLVLRASAATIGTTDPLILAFLAALDRQPGWTVARLARHLEVPIRDLQRECLRVLGVGPGAYLKRHRLQRAATALRGGASLAQTAVHAGIAGATGLSSLVRREIGLTVAQWRSQLRRQAEAPSPGQWRCVNPSSVKHP